MGDPPIKPHDTETGGSRTDPQNDWVIHPVVDGPHAPAHHPVRKVDGWRPMSSPLDVLSSAEERAELRPGPMPARLDPMKA